MQYGRQPRSYPGGGKSFFIDYRIDSRQRRYTIGPFPRWSAEAAGSARRNCASRLIAVTTQRATSERGAQHQLFKT